MFEALRKMIFPIIIIVLLFFVAMIILQWGRGLSRGSSYANQNIAAVINGEKISWQEYNKYYNSLYQKAVQNTDEELPDKTVREIQGKAWQQLLQDRLLAQQVAKNKITVTDDELYAFLKLSPPADLQQMPYFQTNGKFDYQKYVNAMADPKAASFWASLEPIVRDQILKLKLQEMVVQTAHVTEDEIKEFFLGKNEKVKVGMINVGYARFSRPPPTSTDEELKQYYNEHKEDYPIKERAALNIAMVEKKPTPYDWEIGYNKAKAIYDSIKAGADFASMAKKYSEDKTAQEGGDLGWFPKGQMVEAFDRQVFNMKKGDICEPIRTQFGWHIIKVFGFKEVKEAPRGKTKKEKVKKVHAAHILIKVTPSSETIDKAYQKLEQFRALAVKEGFFKAAKEIEMPVRKTAPFFKGRNIQYIGNDANAGMFAFNNNIGDISDIIENNSAVFVVQVAEKLPAGMATFDEAKQKLKLDVLKYKVQKLCHDTAEAIYTAIQKGTPLKKAAKIHGAKYVISKEFDRGSYVQEIGRAPKAIGAAFALTKPGQISPPVDYDQGSVILKLIERNTPDLTLYNTQRDSIASAIMLSKQQELYTRWFNNLVEHSEIVNNTMKVSQNRGI